MKVRFFCYLGNGYCKEETNEFDDGTSDEEILSMFTPWLEQVTSAGWEVIEEEESKH